MAKSSAEKAYTDPITVRFDKDTFEKLSRIRFAVQQLTGAKMAMNALITAAVKEYVEKHAAIAGESAKPKRPKPK
jgi:hypothetical protein